MVDSEDRNVFMVIVLDLAACGVVGHHLVDLNEYDGLLPPSS